MARHFVAHQKADLAQELAERARSRVDVPHVGQLVLYQGVVEDEKVGKLIDLMHSGSPFLRASRSSARPFPETGTEKGTPGHTSLPVGRGWLPGHGARASPLKTGSVSLELGDEGSAFHVSAGTCFADPAAIGHDDLALAQRRSHGALDVHAFVACSRHSASVWRRRSRRRPTDRTRRGRRRCRARSRPFGDTGRTASPARLRRRQASACRSGRPRRRACAGSAADAPRRACRWAPCGTPRRAPSPSVRVIEGGVIAGYRREAAGTDAGPKTGHWICREAAGSR